MPYANVNDIRLYYEEHGQGPALFLVHGFSGAGSVWADFLPPLAERFRVIVPDLRGHGRSDGTLETIQHIWFARDLLALQDHLQIDRAHWVGHSSGGMCLLFNAIEHPERMLTLSLVSATYVFDEHARKHMRFVAQELAPRPEAVANSQRLHSEHHGPDHWRVHIEAFVAFTNNPHELPGTPEALSRIRVPTLVFHGDRDPFFPVNIPVTMYQAIPNAELCILPATGHDLPPQHRELFIQMVTAFIDRHSQQAGAPPAPQPDGAQAR